jgi:hypothetical protein
MVATGDTVRCDIPIDQGGCGKLKVNGQHGVEPAEGKKCEDYPPCN